MAKDPIKPVELHVRVTPGSSKNEVAGHTSGVWKVRLTAPPVEGRANRALTEYLADRLDINRSQVKLLKGDSSRNKVLAVYGLSKDEMWGRLAGRP